MRKTPQYLLTFYQAGDLYRASEDLDRMVVIDNQLKTLSNIVGDGVLMGWSVSQVGSCPTLTIAISPGSGFIGKVVHNTLSIKTATVFDNAQTRVYLKSNLLTSSPQGFQLTIESSTSNVAYATYIDVTPPSPPTNFAASSPEFDLVNLIWDANTEIDFDHYVIQRSPTNIVGSWVTIASPAANGTAGSPYQDENLSASSVYYYRIAAVDKSGNQSTWANATPFPVTTLPDTRKPAEITNLRLFPGNQQISAVFDPSVSDDVVKYVITVKRLNLDGTEATTLDVDNALSQTAQILYEDSPPTVRLKNGYRYRILVRAQNAASNYNDGVSADTSPTSLSAPADATGFSASPGVGQITLAWTASASPTGASIGQKNAYVLTVIRDNVESVPINVGLAVTKTLNSYMETADVGFGQTKFFEDDVPYLFKLAAMDSFGNQSGGVFAFGTTIDVTPPLKPRNFAAFPGDQEATLTWNQSLSADVVGYNINYDKGTGYQPSDVLVGKLQAYLLPLPGANGVNVTIRLRARDDAGNLSGPIFTVTQPNVDTTPPDVISFVKASPMDSQVRASWQASTAPDLDHYIVKRQEIAEPLDSPPNRAFTVLSETLLNLGTATTFIDVGQKVTPADILIQNDHTYAYYISAVDTNGNASEFTAATLVSPSQGLNTGTSRLEAPYSLTAVFNPLGPTIDLSWGFTPPVGDPPTNFNIYRSESPLSGFALVASTQASVMSYSDSNLVSGRTYHYLVTAVRDDASPLVNTGIVQPANTVLLATVTAVAGCITSITNAQRIVENLEATISDETLARLLVHRHSVKPTNPTTATASSQVSIIDASALSTFDFSTVSLSDDTLLYYKSLITDKTTGKAIGYAVRTTYVVDPASVVYNTPYMGDFQILINAARPKVEFTLDENRNAYVFASGDIKSTDALTASGLGFNYYVPARLDNGYRGFEIDVNGVSTDSALVDERLQTLRFLSALPDASVLTVQIEPSVPDFGNQQGARQVSLSPDIVLSDFETTNQKTYVSQSGAFSATDTLFVLVDGERTALDHYVDTQRKEIVFSNPLPTDSAVALEIRGREEVQNLLPPERVLGLDASQITTGTLLKAQFPDISHEGRVQEQAGPIFQKLVSGNNYVFNADQGVIGSGITPYAFFLLSDGNMLLGTSRGFLRTYVPSGPFVGEGDTLDTGSGSMVIEGQEFADGPIKQFFRAATGEILAVTRNSIYLSGDEAANWAPMKGFDAVGTIHLVAQASNGTMFAATDLGAYVLTTALAPQATWFQAGLIGAGTTEVFDLLPFGAAMLAATEIGIFFTSDDGDTWTELVAIDDVFNIELIGGIIFANAGQALYRSDDSGATWSRVGTYSFINQSSRLLARSPLDLFFATDTGLFVSRDGITFSLVAFDLNRQARTNNVQMMVLSGGDVLAGYDNKVFTVGPAYDVTLIAEFSSLVPTVRLNGAEARGGFRYDTARNQVVFEFKRFAEDVVEATSNYSLYRLTGGGWYDQNVNAPVQIYVNRKVVSTAAYDAITGEVAFPTPLNKADEVTVSVAGTSLKNEGEFFHRELDDRLGRQQGLPFGLQQDHAGNLLQFGLSIEHNFLERGIERDQYYCLTGSEVDRSFNSFLKNANFFILGRKDYDKFNSTIDYKVESKQTSIGSAALVPLSRIEYPYTSELWIGTDVGIFALDPNTFVVTESLPIGAADNPVRDMTMFNGDMLTATRDGIYQIVRDPLTLVKTITRNPGNGLPGATYAVSSINNVVIAGTSDTIYYSESTSDPAYSTWFRASYTVVNQTQELFVGGTCSTIIVKDGTAFAGIGPALFSSTNGKQWRKVYEFKEEDQTTINVLAVFADHLMLGTNKGVYNDDGTARTDTVQFRIEITGTDEADSKNFHVNDLFATTSMLYAVGSLPNLLKLQNEAWTSQAITGVPALHKFIVLSNGKKVALANNLVLVE